MNHDHLTIGFLSTWSVYEGTTIDSYTRTLLQGICAAARDHNCNLLLSCGIGLPATPRGSRTAWAIPGSNVDFVPVGPWNCDGLIIIPDDFTTAQFDYVQDLIRTGYPIVLTTAERPGPIVAVDNAGGIRQAFDHLVQHGHQRIAFIAGKLGRGGDSAERLAAYRVALREAGLAEDERLIAFGEHRREDGRTAMRQILATEATFTAVIASNDLSCIGAVEVLRAAGRRIPDDVAVIGFDDIL
ncbi:MAG TPA: substrate-binding domain-containing protein, partial [Anaerolineae bacterium]